MKKPNTFADIDQKCNFLGLDYKIMADWLILKQGEKSFMVSTIRGYEKAHEILDGMIFIKD